MVLLFIRYQVQSQDVDIQAGVAVWNDINGSYDLLTDPAWGVSI